MCLTGNSTVHAYYLQTDRLRWWKGEVVCDHKLYINISTNFLRSKPRTNHIEEFKGLSSTSLQCRKMDTTKTYNRHMVVKQIVLLVLR